MTTIHSSPVQAQRGTDERERLIAHVLERAANQGFPHCELLHDAANMLRADAEQLRARDEEIAGLREYADHLAWCSYGDYDSPCDCGYAALQEKSRDAIS